MQRHEHSQILLAHHALEDGQQLQLIADIEIARRLVEHDELRLLAERAGEQDALPLPVADGLEGPVGKGLRVGAAQALVHNLSVFRGQDAELSRIGIAAAADHVAAGHELRVHAGGHEDGHAAGDGVAAARAQLLAVQIRGAADARQLPGDGLEDGRLAGAVRADERDDSPALHGK